MKTKTFTSRQGVVYQFIDNGTYINWQKIESTPALVLQSKDKIFR